jgi:hypothetical protein
VNAGRDEVLRWLDETGRGTRAAASHFGISRSTIASWVRRSGTRQPRAEVSVSADLRERPAVVVRAELVQPKAPKGEAVDPAALGPVAYYEHALRQIAEDAAAARRLGHSGAVESFTRAALVARKALDEARAAASAKGPEHLDAAARIARLADLVPKWPDMALEIPVAEYCRRHRFRLWDERAGALVPLLGGEESTGRGGG